MSPRRFARPDNARLTRSSTPSARVESFLQLLPELHPEESLETWAGLGKVAPDHSYVRSRLLRIFVQRACN